MRISKQILWTVGISALTALVVSVAVVVLQPLIRPQIQNFFHLNENLLPLPTSQLSIRVPSEAPTTSPFLEDQTVKIVRQARPAVVSVSVLATLPKGKQGATTPDLQPFEDFFGPDFRLPADNNAAPPGPVRIAGGSGFFVSADGIIVTNKHVVQNDQYGDGKIEYTVQTQGGKTFPAKVLAMDPVLDLAFLKVEGDGFPYLTLGDSDVLQAGQTVIAIGNALDEFRNSVTRGVISGLNRRIVAGDGLGSEVIEEAIQTDAAINPGNSGGPLLDMQGKVIGVNTAVSQSGQLLGFAIPIRVVQRDLDSIKKQGRVVRAFMGVRYAMITPEYVKDNQLKVDHGALVLRGNLKTELAVSPGSPADKAGIKENDIILEVDGVSVDEEHSLAALIGRYGVGDTIKLKIYRADEEKEVQVTLEELK